MFNNRGVFRKQDGGRCVIPVCFLLFFWVGGGRGNSAELDGGKKCLLAPGMFYPSHQVIENFVTFFTKIFPFFTQIFPFSTLLPLLFYTYIYIFFLEGGGGYYPANF